MAKVLFLASAFLLLVEQTRPMKKVSSMLDKERSRRTNIVILAVIVSIALVLSIFSYQYSILNSNKIVDIASQEVRSNTKIEVHDISLILANKLQTVGALLQTLAESPALHNNEYKRADIVINNRQTEPETNYETKMHTMLPLCKETQRIFLTLSKLCVVSKEETNAQYHRPFLDSLQ